MQNRHKLVFFIIALLSGSLPAQDSVDVTFRYRSGPKPFLVGEFNGWNNAIWPMSYNGREWERTERLAIGGNPTPPAAGVPGAWQYKFYYDGASPWPNDPLNHHVNPRDNNNSFIYTRDPTIYHLLPNSRIGALDTNLVTISAYIFPKVGSIVDTASITLNIDGTIYENIGSHYNFETKQLNFTPPTAFSDGDHVVILDVQSNADTVAFTVLAGEVRIRPLPGYAGHGVTLPSTASNDSTTFRLKVGHTRFVLLRVAQDGESFVSGQSVLMHRDTAGDDWWVNLELEPGTYKYSYENDSGNLFNDPWGRWTGDDGTSKFTIGPEGLTADNYEWQSDDYVRPPLNRLIIYELHVGEFGGGFYGLQAGEAGFSELITLLPYLDSLGVNAIELMPVNDFGTLGKSGHSWGYDLNSWFALEPSYGTPAEFKALVDSAHALGMAVILDVVFNHLNDTGALWLMLPDADLNPYFKQNNDLRPNEDALFFFRDMDHWAQETQEMVYAVLKMWIDEYRIDGFRYDFTQGIGWNVNEPDKGILGWANRIAEEYDNTIYQIAEHLPESPALILNSGMTGGWHDSYHDEVFDEARFGNTSLTNFESLVLDLRGYRGNDTPSSPDRYSARTEPVNMNVNHDEQSLIYEMTTFQGVSLEDAIQRDKLYATLMFTSLGVPLLWQGMEFSEPRGWRNDGQKLSYRPVSWDMLATDRGRAHYNYYHALIRNRLHNPALYRGELRKLMKYDDEKVLVWGFDDTASDEQVMVIANFNSTEQTINNIPWLAAGDWYDIFDQSVLTVNTTPFPSFKIPRYSSRMFTSSPDSIALSVAVSGEPRPSAFRLFQNYPNPFNPATTINFELSKVSDIKIEIFNLAGQKVRALLDEKKSAGSYQISWDGKKNNGVEVASGIYIIRLTAAQQRFSVKAVKLK